MKEINRCPKPKLLIEFELSGEIDITETNVDFFWNALDFVVLPRRSRQKQQTADF